MQAPSTARAEELLSAPAPEDQAEGMAVDRAPRAACRYTPSYQRFLVANKNFKQQFSHIYCQRLQQQRAALEQRARATWPDMDVHARIINLQEGECVVVGTLYKEMELKPCVLDEYSDQAALAAPVAELQHYSADSDSLVLEDESGRIALEGDIPAQELGTGVAIAVRGQVTDAGTLVVQGWTAAGLGEQDAPAAEPEQGAMVLLASGVSVGGDSDPLALQLLVDFCAGNLGSPEEQAFAARISRVVLAGNSLAPLPSVDLKDRSVSIEQQREATRPLRELDVLLAELTASVHVDVMPGESDPGNVMLPQQPLHRSLFSSAARAGSLRCVTNPYEAAFDDRLFLGSSGQPVANYSKYAKVEGGELKVLENTLQYRHMAPTAPDTLACFPMAEHDPFVIEKTPHVYFAGNMPAFASSLVQGEEGQTVRVICVPDFRATHTAVLVDLATLECQPVTFSVPVAAGAAAEGEAAEGGEEPMVP